MGSSHRREGHDNHAKRASIPALQAVCQGSYKTPLGNLGRAVTMGREAREDVEGGEDEEGAVCVEDWVV